MTREKDFKTKVRARMAKTGERYATARAQLLGTAGSAPTSVPAPRASAFGGAHPETTAVVRIAAAAGLAVSEAMVLGLGGGIGGSYFVFEYGGMPPTFYVGTRCFPQYAYGPEFVRTAAQRLGLELEVKHTPSVPAAAKQLAVAVDAGPAIAWVDLGALPLPGPMPGNRGPMPHVVTVTALAGDTATVLDTGPVPFHLPAKTLAGARGRSKKDKHRLIRATGITAVDRAAAIVDAIRACAAELGGKVRIKAMPGNFGIPGLTKWAALVDDGKDKKGWPRVFARGEHLWSALTWGYHWIETGGTGGSGFRGLYADFLTEAAAITGRPALEPVAGRYRALAKHWTDVARTMLPADIPLLAETRAALDERHAAMKRGDAGLAAATAAQAKVGALRERAAAGELDPHLARVRTELAAQLRTLIDGENAAAAALAAAVT